MQPQSQSQDQVTRTMAVDQADPATRDPTGWLAKAKAAFSRHANFYRLHLVWYLVAPLIASAILYGIDKRDSPYVDLLFLSVSALTVTGLNPVLMEETSRAQQVVTLFLVIMGNTVIVSIVVLFVRRQAFKDKFEYIINTDPRARQRLQDAELASNAEEGKKAEQQPRLGWLGHVFGRSVSQLDPPPPFSASEVNGQSTAASTTVPLANTESQAGNEDIELAGVCSDRRTEDANATSTALALSSAAKEIKRVRTMEIPKAERMHAGRSGEGMPPRSRTMTLGSPMTEGYGGFPNPLRLIASAAEKTLGKRQEDDKYLPRTTTLQTVHSRGGLGALSTGASRPVNYIGFDTTVGRNSRFIGLSSSQRAELGGVEYRALSLLLKIVPSYLILVQLIPMIVMAPIFASGRYIWLFKDTDQGTMTNQGPWFGVFNLASGFSNAGVSLLDDSMIPFQQSYGFALLMGFMILAGNTAFPVFLRFCIWTMSKLTSSKSSLNETLHFLLDHPRRCYIYLFPAYETRVLALMLVLLTSIDWIAFVVLDIGKEVLEALPPAARAIDGLFQAISTRTAGFAIVGLSTIAPALQFLYVVMMYIAIYPIAMSIRSTNVYEEKALGLYDAEDEGKDGDTVEEVGRPLAMSAYFLHHARRQLAFDIWWLGLAVWIICIVERTGIEDPATPYFNVFSILFEVVSAYGTVGLSLGSPKANYSLCGEFRTLSKLVLCAVMIRGRHRALPSAIDRSILLPSDIDALRSASRSNSTRSTVASLPASRNE